MCLHSVGRILVEKCSAAYWKFISNGNIRNKTANNILKDFNNFQPSEYSGQSLGILIFIDEIFVWQCLKVPLVVRIVFGTSLFGIDFGKK